VEACQTHGIPMYATVQFKAEAFCITFLREGGHPLLEHHQVLGQCASGGGVNVDKYMNWVAKKARVEGHGSIYLQLAGVPSSPPEKPVSAGDASAGPG
jgi:hypothetical protein